MAGIQVKHSAAETLKWQWRYRTPKGATGPSIRAHGTFITDSDPNGDGAFAIQRIKGRRNRDRITGLYPAGTSIPGNSPFEGDNLVRPEGTSDGGQLTTGGFQFALDDGSYSNVFFASFLSPQVYLDFHSVSPFPQGAIAPNSETAVVFKAWIIS
ncbi:MAG: hypothetical protein VKJ66_11410 [Synechococcus sp.]|nr:hypothetical protein [Synechococcus sp.]